jgi:hypothetical protein
MGLLRACCAMVLAAVAVPLVFPVPASAQGYAEFQVTMTGDPGPIPKGQSANYVTTVQNVGSESGNAELQLSSYRVDGERPVPNPYLDFSASTGSCERAQWDTKFGTYYFLNCVLPLAPNQSAQVHSTVQINESMDHNSFVSGGGSAEVTTLVNAPPVKSGSKKIKVKGLPDGCASGDFKLKAKARGAKKIVATLRGPLNADGKPEDGGFSDTRKLETAKGAKLKAPIDVGKLESAYYEIKLAAKYDGKPKQKASVLFQSCA